MREQCLIFYSVFFSAANKTVVKTGMKFLSNSEKVRKLCFLFHQKSSVKSSSPDKEKAVSTTLPETSRPVVQKVLDQRPETLTVFEFFKKYFLP